MQRTFLPAPEQNHPHPSCSPLNPYSQTVTVAAAAAVVDESSRAPRRRRPEQLVL